MTELYYCTITKYEKCFLNVTEREREGDKERNIYLIVKYIEILNGIKASEYFINTYMYHIAIYNLIINVNKKNKNIFITKQLFLLSSDLNI